MFSNVQISDKDKHLLGASNEKVRQVLMFEEYEKYIYIYIMPNCNSCQYYYG